jgi:hypothetical protein
MEGVVSVTTDLADIPVKATSAPVIETPSPYPLPRGEGECERYEPGEPGGHAALAPRTAMVSAASARSQSRNRAILGMSRRVSR